MAFAKKVASTEEIEVLKDLRENVFTGQAVHQLLPPMGGGTAGKVHTWKPLL